MRDHGLIFKGPLVEALLEGRKTQTRRPMRDQPPEWLTAGREPWEIRPGLWGFAAPGPVRACRSENTIRCPYIVGDRVWIREPWATELNYDDMAPSALPDEMLRGLPLPIWWGGKGPAILRRGKTRPSIHLPKRFARLWYRIARVRAERVAEISCEDALAEGAPPDRNPVLWFHQTWLECYGPDSLSSWCWCLDLERIERPDDV